MATIEEIEKYLREKNKDLLTKRSWEMEELKEKKRRLGANTYILSIRRKATDEIYQSELEKKAFKGNIVKKEKEKLEEKEEREKIEDFANCLFDMVYHQINAVESKEDTERIIKEVEEKLKEKIKK